MKLFGWKRNKFRLLGLSILSRKSTRRGYAYRLFGAIPVFFVSNPLVEIKKDFDLLKTPMDTRNLDERIEKAIADLPVAKREAGSGFVILATALYDMGGHTECLKNIVAASPRKIPLFLTHMESARRNAQVKLKEIEKYARVEDARIEGRQWKKNLLALLDSIAAENPAAVLSFLHVDDSFGMALLGLLKRARIKILFFNHYSHYPTMGMRFADLILEEIRTTAEITHKERGYTNTKIIGLPYLKESGLPEFSADEIKNKRKELGVPDDAILTMSGASAYKFFDAETTRSPYFEMIRRLLERNPKMFHVVMIGGVTQKQKAVFDALFSGSALENRLKLTSQRPDYKIFFKCADVFIDSFPVSSALTQIDLISLNVPNVIKINRETPMWTFHELMPENYPFAFENVGDMERGIEKLLYDTGLRQKTVEENYRFFLENYEGAGWMKRLAALCESNK